MVSVTENIRLYTVFILTESDLSVLGGLTGGVPGTPPPPPPPIECVSNFDLNPGIESTLKGRGGPSPR